MQLENATQPGHLAAHSRRVMRLVTDVIRVRLSTSDTDGGFSLIELETPVSGGFPLHTQRYDDITYVVLEGVYRIHANGTTRDLEAGACACAPRGTAHGFVNIGNDVSRLLVIASPGGVWERFVDECGEDPPRSRWSTDIVHMRAVAPKYGIAFPTLEAGTGAGGASE